MADINWLDNRIQEPELATGDYLAHLVKIGYGERVSVAERVKARTVTFVFAIEGTGRTLLRTFSRDFRAGSQLREFVRLMLPEADQAANPFTLRQKLDEQRGQKFLLRCEAAAVPGYLEICAARPCF